MTVLQRIAHAVRINSQAFICHKGLPVPTSAPPTFYFSLFLLQWSHSSPGHTVLFPTLSLCVLFLLSRMSFPLAHWKSIHYDPIQAFSSLHFSLYHKRCKVV